MQIKLQIVEAVAVCYLLLIALYFTSFASSDNMLSGVFRRFGGHLLILLSLNTLVRAQPCQNQMTAINGTAFPPLIEATTEDLIRGLESGVFTSVDLVEAYIARIMEVNSTLHMVAQINPDALAIAAQLDAQRARGNVLGPLHGIPPIKNNIATADAMDNTAGSYALAGAKVPRDSTIAAKLRKSGAIILGKTNLSQWANYRCAEAASLAQLCSSRC